MNRANAATDIAGEISNHYHKVTPVFARHETFHPRFGWLKKGFDKVSIDENLFTREEAPITLGVGKNMVKAIRYWCWAFKLLDELPGEKSARIYRPTDLGTKLLQEGGWDPYLENVSSLWLLHWNLMKIPCQATTWHYVFNVFKGNEFTLEQAVNDVFDYAENGLSASRISKTSIEKDMSCLLRMYVAHRENGVKEESLNSPFTSLGLIRTIGYKQYTFVIGEKPELAFDIVVAACLEYASIVQKNVSTISITRLLYDIASPGMVFKITESFLLLAIETVANSFPKISLSDTAGIIQLSYIGDPQQLSLQLLDSYYQNTNDLRRL